MTIAVVQSKFASGTLPVSVTLDAAPTVDNVLFAIVGQVGTQAGAPPISSSGSWTAEVALERHAADLVMMVASHLVVMGDTATFVLDTGETGADARVGLIEVSGIASSSSSGGAARHDATTSMSMLAGAGLSGAFALVASIYDAADAPATGVAGMVALDDANTSGVGRVWTGYRSWSGGTTTVGATVGSATDWALTVVAFRATSTPGPGVWVDWDGSGFVDETTRTSDWTITRGASPELTAGSQPGSATVNLINTPDDRFNPENSGGDLYGFLHDGPRVWIGVNDDGTVTAGAHDILGLHAGRITDLSPQPVSGATVAPFTEMVTADPFEWASRQKVTLADSRTRSQADLRAEVISFLGWPFPAPPAEPTTLPLSSADGLALGILDALNASNGTRHFAKPSDVRDDWFDYVAVRRTDGLDGTSAASIDAGAQHVTGTSGWRRSADGIVNQQKATVVPVDFPARVVVWTPELLPITVEAATPLVIWADFSDYVDAPEVDYTSTGSGLTPVLEPFGRSAKLTLTSAGTTTISVLRIFGWQVVRGPAASVVIDDATSQAEPRGIRAGPDLSGDYLGTLTTAAGFAGHIVWRFGNPLYRPTMTVVNWMPEMFGLDLFDRIAVTVAELSITGRIFEIVGLTLQCDLAAYDGDGNPVVNHTATYVLQESRVQTTTDWFTWDVSDWDDAASPWAY